MLAKYCYVNGGRKLIVGAVLGFASFEINGGNINSVYSTPCKSLA